MAAQPSILRQVNSPVSLDVIVVNTDVLLSTLSDISLFAVVICAAKCLKTGRGMNHQADTSQVGLPRELVEREERV